MSYELIGILTVGAILGLGQIATMIYAIQGFKEMQCVQRALGGLVIQESERLQTLLRSTP